MENRSVCFQINIWTIVSFVFLSGFQVQSLEFDMSGYEHCVIHFIDLDSESSRSVRTSALDFIEEIIPYAQHKYQLWTVTNALWPYDNITQKLNSPQSRNYAEICSVNILVNIRFPFQVQLIAILGDRLYNSRNTVLILMQIFGFESEQYNKILVDRFAALQSIPVMHSYHVDINLLYISQDNLSIELGNSICLSCSRDYISTPIHVPPNSLSDIKTLASPRCGRTLT